MRLSALGSILIIFLILATGSARAQEMEPRAYSNAPTGMNFLAAGYGWSHGNIVTDAALPVTDLQLSTHSATLGYLRTFGLLGKQAKIGAMVPFAWLAGDAQIAGRDTSGTRSGPTDARVKLSVNLLGGPALSRAEFKSYQQETIVGVSVVVAVPIGQYDADKRINLGTNRWGFKPEVGISRRVSNWYLEVYTGVWFFTDNSEYLETLTLSQDPVWGTQGHLGYVFKPGLWAAVNSVYVDGGATSVNGVEGQNFQKNWRFGATFALPIARQHALKFVFNTGVATRAGSDFDAINVVYQYSWF